MVPSIRLVAIIAICMVFKTWFTDAMNTHKPGKHPLATHGVLSTEQLEEGCYIRMSFLLHQPNFPLLVEDGNQHAQDIGAFLRPIEAELEPEEAVQTHPTESHETDDEGATDNGTVAVERGRKPRRSRVKARKPDVSTDNEELDDAAEPKVKKTTKQRNTEEFNAASYTGSGDETPDSETKRGQSRSSSRISTGSASSKKAQKPQSQSHHRAAAHKPGSIDHSDAASPVGERKTKRTKKKTPAQDGDASYELPSSDEESEDEAYERRKRTTGSSGHTASRTNSRSPTGASEVDTDETDSDEDESHSNQHHNAEEATKGVLYIANGESVTAACPGKKKTQRNILEQSKKTSARITCHGGNNISVEGHDGNVKFGDLKCNQKVKSEMVRAEQLPPSSKKNELELQCKRTDDKGAAIYFIAWEIGNTYFWQIAMCHNPKEVRTYFTEHRLIREIHLRNQHKKRPPFLLGLSCAGMKDECNKAYEKDEQKKVLVSILGRDEVEQIFEKSVPIKEDHGDSTVPLKKGERKKKPKMNVTNKGHYLAQGHLSPDADFLNPEGSFYKGNIAPEWQAINVSSWKIIEMEVQHFAGIQPKGKDIIVQTGTLWTVEYKNQFLFLIPNSTPPAIPVPMLFWKGVFNMALNMAIYFITINDIFLRMQNIQQHPLEKFIICKDVINQSDMTWLKNDGEPKKNIKDTKHGYTYACTAKDFQKAVKYAHNFENNVQLLNSGIEVA